MEVRKLIECLMLAEKLKDTLRHCYTKQGRRESVAEHTWLMTLMAYFVSDEFPELDVLKVMKMCLIHDLGEAFTGDIPAYDKNQEHEELEEKLLMNWVSELPEPYQEEMSHLYVEMKERTTLESKVYKALDGLEALIQHNISDLSTWEDYEYEFSLTYADDKVEFSPYFKTLREAIRKDTLHKIEEGS